MDYFIDSGALGSDRNSGTHRRSPRKTLPGGAALTLKPGDRLLIRQGSVFDSGLTWALNGVTVTSYTLGTEGKQSPLIKLPHIKGLRGLSVSGKDNLFEDIQIEGAETGVFVDAKATGNRFHRAPVDDYGWGYLIHGSDTDVIDSNVTRGRMVRNVMSEDYVGASAFTLWKDEFTACENITIIGAKIQDAWAWRVPKEDGKDTDGDGCGLEVFGGVKHVQMVDCDVLASKTLCEVGGTKTRKETASDVRFVRCTTSGPSGKCFFVNDPLGTFGIGWEGFSFDQCIFTADGYPESPFYLAGNHGDLSTKLSLTNTKIVAAAQILNGGKGTLLETFAHEGNTFWRSDGSKNIGFKLHSTDRFEPW